MSLTTPSAAPAASATTSGPCVRFTHLLALYEQFMQEEQCGMDKHTRRVLTQQMLYQSLWDVIQHCSPDKSNHPSIIAMGQFLHTAWHALVRDANKSHVEPDTQRSIVGWHVGNDEHKHTRPVSDDDTDVEDHHQQHRTLTTRITVTAPPPPSPVLTPQAAVPSSTAVAPVLQSDASPADRDAENKTGINTDTAPSVVVSVPSVVETTSAMVTTSASVVDQSSSQTQATAPRKVLRQSNRGNGTNLAAAIVSKGQALLEGAPAATSAGDKPILSVGMVTTNNHSSIMEPGSPLRLSDGFPSPTASLVTGDMPAASASRIPPPLQQREVDDRAVYEPTTHSSSGKSARKILPAQRSKLQPPQAQ